MANETFNPEGYSKQEIADALKYATNDHETVEQHAAMIQLLSNQISNGLSKLQENTIDIMQQIAYKGSANRLHLENATLTVPEVPGPNPEENPEVLGLTATLEDGIVTIRKIVETAEDVTITVSGIKLAAGGYYMSVGDSLNSRDDIISMLAYGNNDEYIAVVTNTDDISVTHYVTISSDITNGKLEFVIDKDYVSHVYFTVTPMFSETIFDKAFVMPYFKSLSEVSEDA